MTSAPAKPPPKKPDPKPVAKPVVKQEPPKIDPPPVVPQKIEPKPEPIKMNPPLEIPPKIENKPEPEKQKIFDPIPEKTLPDFKLPDIKADPPKITKKPVEEPQSQNTTNSKPLGFKEMLDNFSFPPFNLGSAPKKNKKKILICVTHETGKSQTQEEVIEQKKLFL